MTPARVLAALLVIALWAICDPIAAFAWTPGTHIFLGETILANLHLLPPTIANLLQAFPYDFHYWNVGQETFDQAPSESLRAFGLGYLSHLAADTIAHNYFVPRQLVLTTSTRSMGHTYWESRIETHLGGHFARRAREIIQRDQSEADLHLERIISPTLFSVRTNRRIFRGMVHLTHTRSWHRAMQAAADRSRWLLTDRDVERHLGIAYDVTVDMLAGAESGAEAAKVRSLDPNGAQALRAAKRLRRRELEHGSLGSPSRLLEVAEESFHVRAMELGHWAASSVERPWLREPGLPAEPLIALAEE
jgi:hypothetical protein